MQRKRRAWGNSDCLRGMTRPSSTARRIPTSAFQPPRKCRSSPPQGTLDRFLLHTEQTGWAVLYTLFRKEITILVRSKHKAMNLVTAIASISCGRLKVSDRPSRLFSAQQETVQRSPGWDWIFTCMVAEMRASGCSILSI